MTYHRQLKPEASLPLAHRVHPAYLSAHPLFKYRIHSPNPQQAKILHLLQPVGPIFQPPAFKRRPRLKSLCKQPHRLKRNNNLPPLKHTNLTSQSAEENIDAVVKALNAVQEDDRKKRWRYTWRGKEVVVVKRLGTILKNVGQYTKVVDTAIQSNPQVALNHVEVIEGLEVAIAALLEKMTICEFYAGLYVGAPLTSGSAANSLQRQRILHSALPELYAAVIVFEVKARAYFEARGLKKVTNTLKSYDIEFQPFIEDINAKERVIRECADAVTMEKIRNIEGVLQDITSELKPLAELNEISTTATHTLKVTEEIRNNTQDDRILELFTLLTPLEPLKRHQDVKMIRTKNAAAWLLSSESFCNWRDSNTIPIEDCIRVFCCFGIPGAGKTVISSVVIDELYSQIHKYPRIGIACLYADYKDQNNQILVHILGSFLRQLLTTAQETIPKELIDMLAKIKQQGRKVATEDILALLRIRLQQLKRAFICIDAVDELAPKVQQQLLDVLKELGTNHNNTRFFITGREHVENEVKKRLQAMQQHKIVISATRQDIEEFLRQQIGDDLDADAMDEALQKKIIEAIIGKSQGMFLLPALHIKMILGMTTKSKRRKALETLPTDLYDSFKGVITRIRECLSKSQAELGMRVLMWLHFAYRPLKLAELQHALAVEKGDTEFDAENIPSRKALLDCCLGLVIVDEETLTVRFVHYTLEEYFRKYAGTEFPDGHSSIAESCLTYLNFANLRQHCMDDDSLNAKLKEYTFLDYASLYWGTYFKHQCNDGLRKLANMILNHESNCPPCSIQVLQIKLESLSPGKRFSGPHVAAYFGSTENLAYLCEMGWNIQQKDDGDRTPLSWAAEQGHEAVVHLLIERHDVDINAKDVDGRTSLSWAAANGREAVCGC
ncbi:hypothetical protein L211DRAFT_124964 [Terfezia boudieri ATCC MYA-4762]|uniref:Uncharacterized protein n=1 Tax=Terfezia boudieri ATCC MYA-4762 TaxID=1051890 RepID=A0A3N4LK36_9PEZI|nr:hypothetical protein L211DRAFT_124964 [Terfezia boudieri ATCC MYA-4762]